MTQEIFPAREVAARDIAVPPANVVQLADKQELCNLLDVILPKDGFDRLVYSDSFITLLQLAWSVALHKRSKSVTVQHLAYALVFGYPEIGGKLADHMGSEREPFAVGCVLNILNLSGAHEPGLAKPSVDAVRWVGSAGKIARGRGKMSEVVPEDLLRAVVLKTIPRSVWKHLRTAASAGKRSDIVIGQRPINAPASPEEIVMQIDEFQKGLPAADLSDRFSQLADLIEDYDERHSAELDDQKRSLATADRRLALIEQRVLPIDDVRRKLEMVDRRIAALPQPPSGTWLAAAIAAVLALGAGTGLILTQL